jgi:hypothetical protein
VEAKEEYQVKISNRSAGLENTVDNVTSIGLGKVLEAADEWRRLHQ